MITYECKTPILEEYRKSNFDRRLVQTGPAPAVELCFSRCIWLARILKAKGSKPWVFGDFFWVLLVLRLFEVVGIMVFSKI